MKLRIFNFLPAPIRNRRNLTLFGCSVSVVGIVGGNLGVPALGVVGAVGFIVTCLVAFLSTGEV